MSIHMNSGAEMSTLTKIAQLQTKLPRTAAIEMALLTFFQRRVNKAMTAAETSGRSNANHGSKLLVVKVISWPANHANGREYSEGHIGKIPFGFSVLCFGNALVLEFWIVSKIYEQAELKPGGI